MGTKKKWRVRPKIVNWVFRFISFVLFCYILGMLFFPDTMINLTGFQFYTVLSGSMEPKIPTYSLVLSKSIKSDDELVPGTIITFHANRLGEDTVLTHTLAKTEVESDGRVRYYTQAYAYEGLDEYHTYRQDIVGIYVMHVPFVGKIVMFFQSPYAWFTVLIVVGILLLSWIVQLLIDRNELIGKRNADKLTGDLKEIEQAEFVFDSTTIQNSYLVVKGLVVYQGQWQTPIARIDFMNEKYEILDTALLYLRPKKSKMDHKLKWVAIVKYDKKIKYQDAHLYSLDYPLTELEKKRLKKTIKKNNRKLKKAKQRAV
ncbi:signal peptidase I [Holdemania massiliensis]|uniref:Signal peptidase I n=1 Tax=Holdemania massiliensis TaxID=1468449 RepID=A0A6N7SBJ6_9FIRM|nr:signal peptidase I [Holdemania massiliensis]MSA73030.1 signal peptidase I [Holdemania massiliensis]MSA91227.1 signal peptidase I [Holdemania massiliensis]MSB80083.1 signal peptidase I [Holdemania massiliensis]MSC35004.1 signal peptidase I [Holdemania massiliensis]MSC41393.1 signal peptidase I [Holdemania massiliensis]